ncbi:type II secretion system protein GspL [Acinetobacter equi]|uniref:Type II secretion system protein L n=1 Tax=Acinetobacter equi TaxID=1324350 RepID=A0A0N7GY30_9GAMM|nr:type II secretion system protein GspL [Acinetobacter equi]ALH96371.1 general secretion pathway protein GspL [Acinetobacter equi]
MLHLWMPETNGIWFWSIGETWFKAESLEMLIHSIQSYHGTETVVYFPSRHLQAIQQTLSKPQYIKLGNDGVRYLLEEFTIQPIDSMKVMHFFQQPDQLFISGISNQTLENIIHSLMLIPVKVVALLPDFLVLPLPEKGQTVIANLGDRLLVREGEFTGNSIDDLSIYIDFQKKEQCYRVADLNYHQYKVLTSCVTEDQIEVFDLKFESIKKIKQHPWNFIPKSKSKSTVTDYWKTCIAVIIAIIFVQFSYDALRWMKLKNVANQTAEQAIQQYKSWFGQNLRVTEQNIRSEFKGQMNASQTANLSALNLLSQIGPIMMQNQIIADQINYDEQGLNMVLKAKDTQSLQNLSQQLSQQGLKVELGNIKTDTLGVVGLVKVQ